MTFDISVIWVCHRNHFNVLKTVNKAAVETHMLNKILDLVWNKVSLIK